MVVSCSSSYTWKKLLIIPGFDVLGIQPNVIAKDIALRLDAIVMNLFLKFLDMVEVFLANNH